MIELLYDKAVRFCLHRLLFETKLLWKVFVSAGNSQNSITLLPTKLIIKT